MPKARQQVASVTPDDIETAFYDALRKADIERLMDCWADEDDIVCIHPGGPRLVGMLAIRTAFDSIFSHGGPIHVRPESIRRMESQGSAVHSILERVDVMSANGPIQAYVLATNVYQLTPRGWRLVLHHASPGTQDEAQEVHASAPVLH